MKLVFRFSDTGRTWAPSLRGLRTLQLTVNSPRKAAWWLALLVFMVSLSATVGAQLQPNAPHGIFDEIAQDYQSAAMQWEGGLRSIANNLFAMLAVISIAWTFIKLALQKDDIKAFVPTMTLQIMTLGFFYYLVQNGSEIATMIIQSFDRAAVVVSPSTANATSPSMVAATGFDVFFRIGERISEFGLSDSLTVGLLLSIVSLLILLAFAGIAILLLVTLIEATFVLYGGILLLGFGALPWTRDIPKNYLIYAINVGVKLFVLNLVVGIGVGYAESWPDRVTGASVAELVQLSATMLIGGLVFMAVAWKVPGIAAAISSGSLNFNAGDAMGMTAAAAGTGAAVGAMATGGASAAIGGLAQATKGTIQAGSAGMSLAAEQGASGLQAAVKGLGHAARATAGEAGSALKSKVGLSPPSPHSVDQRGREVGNFGTRAANALGEQTQALRESNASKPASPPQTSTSESAPRSDDSAAKPGNSGGLKADAPPVDNGAQPSNGATADTPQVVEGPQGTGAGDSQPGTAGAPSGASATDASPDGGPAAPAPSAPAPSASDAATAAPAAAGEGAASPAPPVSGGNQGTAPAPSAPGNRGPEAPQHRAGDKAPPRKLLPPEVPPNDAAHGGVSISFDSRDD